MLPISFSPKRPKGRHRILQSAPCSPLMSLVFPPAPSLSFSDSNLSLPSYPLSGASCHCGHSSHSCETCQDSHLCCKCRNVPFHNGDNLNIKFLAPTPILNPSPVTASCHCGHPANYRCRACTIAQGCCLCYLSLDHNCELLNDTFLHWHSGARAKRLRGGMRTPEEPTRSPAPSPPSPARQALHKLATRPLTPPPVECPCGHVPNNDCISCQTHERCCQCSYRPHYTPPYNPDCPVCLHTMSKCLTCSDMKQCHECLLRLTMPNPGPSTHLLKPNQPDPASIGRAPSMPLDIPPPPSNRCHHCKHEMATCTRCAVNRMCCQCNPAAMKTEQDDVRINHNDKLTVDNRPSLRQSPPPLPESKPRPIAHRRRHHPSLCPPLRRRLCLSPRFPPS